MPPTCTACVSFYTKLLKSEHAVRLRNASRSHKSAAGFELSKNKWGGGLTSAFSLSLSLHTSDSASLTTAGG
jgi:hypothetical protein